VRIKEVPWRLLAIIFAGSITTATILRFAIWVSQWELRQYVEYLMDADPEEREVGRGGFVSQWGLRLMIRK
jgi:hypothetical protein